MQIEDDGIECIKIEAMDVEELLLEAKERIEQKAVLDKHYRTICKHISCGRNMDKEYTTYNDIPCCKNRLYLPEALRKRTMKSEHDSKVAGPFGQDRTMKLIFRNFSWPNKETDVRKY